MCNECTKKVKKMGRKLYMRKGNMLLSQSNITGVGVGAVATAAGQNILTRVLPTTINTPAGIGLAEMGVAVGMEALYGGRSDIYDAAAETMFAHGATEAVKSVANGTINTLFDGVQNALRGLLGGNSSTASNAAALLALQAQSNSVAGVHDIL